MTLFYRLQAPSILQALEGNFEQYHSVLWKPSWFSIIPKGVPFMPFVVWWLFHSMRLFYNRDYALLLIYDGDRLIHRSGVFPGYFRFPFMAKNDLQIGDTDTASDYRGKGLATFAVQQILKSLPAATPMSFWYLVEAENAASIRVIEKAGFELIGKGRKKKRFGLSIFGYYDLETEIRNDTSTVPN